ncbi:MAG: hypothetical protein KDC34_04900 [Saprospiraceae bacterium]|nr:hypothetical protein [Saprospiraceae bacterium]
MGYHQYTKCTSPANFIGSAAAQAIIGAAIGALPLVLGLVFGSLALGPGALAAMLIPVGALIAYCRWWLFDRLICLGQGKDVCTVGRLISVEPPDDKSGLDAFDTDYSINILLAPNDVGATQAEVEADGIQGHLIKNQQEIIDLGLDFSGYTAKIKEGEPDSAVIHAEFEGGGVFKLLQVALALLGYLTAALIAATIICAIPVVGWIACLIVSLIFAAIGFGILAMGMNNALKDTGNPNHVNANLGTLEVGKDLLVTKGTWVFDSAHSGYNEIHPVKHCQRIGKWSGSWQAAFDSIVDLVPANVTVDAAIFQKFWCDAIASAESPETQVNIKRPENQWVIHPVIDGCEPKEVEEPPPVPK